VAVAELLARVAVADALARVTDADALARVTVAVGLRVTVEVAVKVAAAEPHSINSVRSLITHFVTLILHALNPIRR